MQMKTKLALFVGLVLLACALMFTVCDGNTEPTITIEDGYIVINGVKTEHEVKNKNHSFGDWKLYNEDETNCEKKLYYRTCPDCSTIEWKEGKYEDHSWITVTTQPTCQAGGYDTKTCATCGKVEICNETSVIDHAYGTSYLSDKEYHWLKCANCEATKDKAEHKENEEGTCATCDALIGATSGLVYDISADETYAEVIGYNGTATRIKIAEEYNGLPVTKIANGVFSEKNIVSIIIPDGVTSIGPYAFQNCNYLTSIAIPNNLTEISNYAFYGCSRLTRITIPNSVTSIGDYAFYECSGLTSIVIPNSVTSLGEQSFYDCRNLTSITIGNGVTTIGIHAFEKCTGLQSVYINDIAAWCKILFKKYSDDLSIYSNPLYYAKELYLNNVLLKELVVPESVTYISAHAFRFYSNLTSVTLHNGVVSIDDYAFSECKNLKSVILGDEMTYIGNNIFYGCDSLTYNEYQYGKYLGSNTNPYLILMSLSNKMYSNYMIHENTKIIHCMVFWGCVRIESITIPNQVIFIGDAAFGSCDNLKYVAFENPNGWSVVKKNRHTSSIDAISSNTLSSKTNAAEYLLSIYNDPYYSYLLKRI